MSSGRPEPRPPEPRSPAEGAPGAGTSESGGRDLWRRRSLSLRLTLGYAALFALSALTLFVLTYGLLIGYLLEQDRAYTRVSLQTYAEAYARGGVAGVERTAAAVRKDDLGEETLVRVADAAGRTLLLLPPEDWRPSDLAALDGPPPADGTDLSVRNDREDLDLDLTTRRLPDGSVLQVGVSSDERDDVMESFPDVFLTLSLPLLLLALVGGAFMAHRALRPIRQLVRTFRAITATGDVRERAPVPTARGELTELFVLFNRMLDRIEALVRGLGDTLDDVAHDLRTPVTRLRGAAELALREDRDAEAYRDALADALEAAEALTVSLDVMMDVAEAEAGTLRLHREPARMADLVDDVASLYELVAEEKGVDLRVDTASPAVASVDRSRMRQALANLVDNAVKYTPPGGQVEVEVGEDGGSVRVSVRDTGVGIAPEDLPRIWDRLYRGDRSRSERGLGLGLSLVRAIVEAHGGSVDVESRLGAGATFTVRLPPSAAGPPGDRWPLGEA